MRALTICVAISALLGVAAAAEKKLQMKDLPPAVQKTVQDQTKGAEIKGISSETEKGKLTYEIETMVSGKHRDFLVDAKGAVTEVEDEAALDSIPAAAKAAIEKKVGTGKITLIEAMTRTGSTEKLYEASYTDKGGKKHEVLVKADGTETKD
jgi:Zn-dependent oligopeptidase